MHVVLEVLVHLGHEPGLPRERHRVLLPAHAAEFDVALLRAVAGAHRNELERPTAA